MEPIQKSTAGSLKISEDVLATVTRLAIQEIDGVHCLAQSIPTVKEMVFTTNASRPVKISLNGDVAQIDVSVIVKFGYKIRDVAEEIQNAVKDSVQNMTGVTVSKVNIYVAGVKFGDAQK